MNHDIQNIRLKFKCPANWDEMTPLAGGRFCDHCAKVVYDFTDAKQAEFQKILIESANGFCGRFRAEQMAPELTLLPRWKQWAAAGIMLLGASFFTQCKSQTEERPPMVTTMGVPLVPLIDTTERVMGKVATSNPLCTKKSEVKFPPPVLMGDVVVNEPAGKPNINQVLKPKASASDSSQTVLDTLPDNH